MSEDKNIELSEKWDLVITGKKTLLSLQLNDIWRYRDLLLMMVKRDVVVLYKQTILGPLWFFIQPILTVIVYTVVFGRIAGLPTNGIPPVLFYLAGIIIWNYFAECFNQTSNTFVQNASLFGKVYFPRMVVPISKVISGLLKFLIQFLLFLAVYGYYLFRGESLNTSFALIYLPVMVMIMGILGLGMGIFFTSLTTKYRDLTFLIQFGVQLLMYATPVIYPASMVHGKLKILIDLNPMTAVVEGFRTAFFNTGTFDLNSLLTSLAISVIIFVVGLGVFNYTEKDFMDTV